MRNSRRTGTSIGICLGLALLLPIPAASPVEADMQTFTAGIPNGPSPNASGNYLMIVINYRQNGVLKMQTVKVTVPAAEGLPFPTPAQAAAASAAKANAIANAVNQANIPGVTASVPAATVQRPYPTGAMAEYQPGRVPPVITNYIYGQYAATQFTISGVSPPTNPNGTPGSPVQRAPGNNVTGELGDGTQAPVAGGNPPPPPPPPPFNGSFKGGSGATPQSATGLDVAGNPSVIEFGFIDNSGPSPVDYIEGIQPTVGEDDADILGSLADLFNNDYSADGYTATYDPTDDSLSLDQSLPGEDELYEGDSDTGSYFYSEMDLLPEPASAASLLAAAAGAMVRRRRH
jgi:hypothetical protein